MTGVRWCPPPPFVGRLMHGPYLQPMCLVSPGPASPIPFTHLVVLPGAWAWITCSTKEGGPDPVLVLPGVHRIRGRSSAGDVTNTLQLSH